MEPRHHEHWYWWGAGALIVGAGFLALAPSGHDSTGHAVDRWTQWEAFVAYGAFALALFCGFAGARGWRFPLTLVNAPLLRGRRAPKWRDRIGSMKPRQIAHLEALERERDGYIKRHIPKSVREVNKQMKIARDAWWETEPDSPDLQEQSREISRAAKMLGTELRDIRSKIERAKAAGFYPRGFRFPGEEFTNYRVLLSESSELYEKVERAYSAAHNTNMTLGWREERQGDGRELLGVLAGDGLDVTHGAAGEALDALGERHNDPFVADPGRASASSTPTTDAAPDPITRRHSQIIIDQIGDDNEKRGEVSALITRGFDLRGEVRNPTMSEMTAVAWELMNGRLRPRIDRWCNDARGFIYANVYGVPTDLISEERETELLDQWDRVSVVTVLDAHIGVLKRARDAISPTRLG